MSEEVAHLPGFVDIAHCHVAVILPRATELPPEKGKLARKMNESLFLKSLLSNLK